MRNERISSGARAVRPVPFVLLFPFVLSVPACTEDGDAGPDASTDADADADTDADTDADADGDGDADAGPDGGEALPPMSVYESACGGADGTPACLFFVDVGAPVDGGSPGDGLSWATAFGTIQEGIDAARAALGGGPDAGASTCHVWVAEGAYLPTVDASGDAAPADPQTVTISLREGVNVYGGFDGTEAACDDRDVAAHETIFSGDIGTAGDRSDNAYATVTGADGAVIDGFTIRECGIDTWSDTDGAGCVPGYGMLNDGASPIVANCTFRDIRSRHDWGDCGGAVLNRGGASPRIYDTAFLENESAVINSGAATRPLFHGCLFHGNDSWSCPGDFCGGSGALVNDDAASPLVVGCRFIGNRGDAGGAIGGGGASTRIVHSVFMDNSASGWGGAILVSTSMEITGCTFSNNTADGWGGGTGASIALEGSAAVRLVNSVVSGGGSQIGYPGEGGAAGDPACEARGTDIYWTGDGLPCPGEDNLEADPLFAGVEADAGASDLRLQPGSPCIDTGRGDLLPADFLDLDRDGDTAEPIPYDIDGNPRAAGASVDMGAYEYQP